MNNTLIVFARVPILGKVKTRLSEEIGQIEALDIYNQLLNNTLEAAFKSEVNVKIYWSEAEENSNDNVQDGKDLGERMFNAFKKEYIQGQKVCLIGTDSPLLTNEIINTAFNKLKTNDIVLGPAKDGGYYLIGMKSSPPEGLFLNRKWSHKDVLKDTLDVCTKLELKVGLTPVLLDIDTKEDLTEWQNHTS